MTTLVISIFPYGKSQGVPLIKFYSWLSEWLDSNQMVMVIWKLLKTTLIITLDNSCNFNFPLKKVPECALDQVLILALRGAGHQPDGPSGLGT